MKRKNEVKEWLGRTKRKNDAKEWYERMMRKNDTKKLNIRVMRNNSLTEWSERMKWRMKWKNETKKRGNETKDSWRLTKWSTLCGYKQKTNFWPKDRRGLAARVQPNGEKESFQTTQKQWFGRPRLASVSWPQPASGQDARQVQRGSSPSHRKSIPLQHKHKSRTHKHNTSQKDIHTKNSNPQNRGTIS